VLERQVVETVAAQLVALTDPAPPITPLTALAEVVGTAAGASGCALTVAGERHQWGDGPGPWLEHVITYGGEQQGVLAITPESAGPLPAVAELLGAPIAVARLETETDRLRRAGDTAARELIDDRWRAAAEMEQERRGLERDLHDGAQHHLVALRMSLALVEHAIAGGGGTQEQVDKLLERLDGAERVLLDTAAGVLPMALVTNGLAAALSAELANHADVTLDIAELRRRYPAVVESAVYFTCLEAVNNAHKHTQGARITVSVRDSYRGLEFSVTDTGPGFDVSAATSGLRNLTVRAADVGGSVAVDSASGRGTRVSGFVPL
jgi:signal transduction histidine kinase